MEIDKSSKIGEGSYGNIFKIKNSNLCVKICKNNQYLNYLEPLIMMKINHKNINSASYIFFTNENLYIVQQVAISSLTKFFSKVIDVNIAQIKNFSLQICNAILYLHQNLIIHGDIKGDNILIFDGGLLKITDFSLSVKKLNDKQKFKEDFCTSTHRPLECFYKDYSSEKVDIWALGCCLYEVFYKNLLFPKQSYDDDRDLFYKKCVNAIYYWKHDRPKYKVNFIKHSYASDFHLFKMKSFNDFLFKILILEDKNRLSIDEVIKLPFLTPISDENNIISDEKKLKHNDLKKEEKISFLYKIEKIVDNLKLDEKYKDEIKQKAYETYLTLMTDKVRNMNINEDKIINCILFIIMKLLRFNYSDFNKENMDFVYYICNLLQFQF
jgi:serine/threonine protein kinase